MGYHQNRMISVAQIHDTWKTAPARPIVEKDSVHVWRVSLGQPPEKIQSLLDLLTSDEKQRASSYFATEDTNRFIVARGTLRIILSRYLEINPDQLRFNYNQYGKPALIETRNASGLRFNVSHSKQISLCAITREREVGIDVELIREDVDFLYIASHFFSQDEVRALHALQRDLQKIAFFNCWTRKEAYIKARGEGLSHPLDRFTVSLMPGEPAGLLSSDNDMPELSLRELSVAEDHAATLAAEGPLGELFCWDWQ